MLRRWLFLWAVWPNRSKPNNHFEVCRETPMDQQARWDSSPTVLLLVPFRNEAAVLPSLLAHLHQLDYPPTQLTTVLIDDGSTDDSPQLAQTWVNGRPHCHLLKLPHNGGKASALNAALAHFPQGELVAVFDADERPSPTTLSHLAVCFMDKKVGAVNGRRVVSNSLASLFASASTIESLVHQLVTMQAKQRLNLAPALLGSNCVYRRQALAAVGGFQPGALLEDSDLSLKLVAAGWQTGFCPQAISTHVVPQTWRGHWRQHRRWASGFGHVARQQAAQIITNQQLAWPMRLELLAFSCGYADRVAWLVLGVWLGVKTAVHRHPPWLSLTIFLMSLITPLFQVMVALRQAQAPAALWQRILLLPCLLPLQMAFGLLGLWQKKVNWEMREQQQAKGIG